ncbi:2-aminoethylphosphonate--pyruvate transaminase-like isoform X2 [Homarus americanus]|nr:2-aminoethylphosphonate--pyruvate transaminase-like isoform X2 [Homarus americanus]
MQVDLSSRDQQFMSCVTYIRQTLLDIAQVTSEEYTVVPLQGSGTFCVEAVLQTTSPRVGAKVLVLSNGAYGCRMVTMCECARVDVDVQSFPEDQPLLLSKVEEVLASGEQWTTVAMVHCETSSGVVNPVEAVGRLVRLHQPKAAYLVDAMSSFGVIPVNMRAAGVDYLVSSANKCLEGVPGFGYAICRKEHLLSCKGNCRVLSLDLAGQYLTLEATGQFRFTPPTHSMLAFTVALREYIEAGGLTARAARYQENRVILVDGMKKLGYTQLVPDRHASPVITAFHYPKHPQFVFKEFFNKLVEKGQVIYPGKVTIADCFRVGNIGQLFPDDMRNLLFCMEEVMKEMGLPVPLP